jgi:hypothetical protein
MYLAKNSSSFGVGVAAQIALAMTESVLIVATISTSDILFSYSGKSDSAAALRSAAD